MATSEANSSKSRSKQQIGDDATKSAASTGCAKAEENAFLELNDTERNELIFAVFNCCEGIAERELLRSDFLTLSADLSDIRAKCQTDNMYKTQSEFLGDMKKVRTKWLKMDTQDDAALFKRRERIMKVLNKLCQHCKCDMDAAKFCSDCVINYYIDHDVKKVCRKPHHLGKAARASDYNLK